MIASVCYIPGMVVSIREMIVQRESSERCFCEVSYFVTSEANRGVFCFIIMVWISASGVKLGPGHFFQGFLLTSSSVYTCIPSSPERIYSVLARDNRKKRCCLRDQSITFFRLHQNT